MSDSESEGYESDAPEKIEEEDYEDEFVAKVQKKRHSSSDSEPDYNSSEDDRPKRKKGYKKAATKQSRDNTLYCVCKRIYDESQFYIACDYCDDWLHGACVGIPEAQGAGIDKFMCPICCEQRNLPYAPFHGLHSSKINANVRALTPSPPPSPSPAPLDEPPMCSRSGCTEHARPTSAFCSMECGLAAAQQTIQGTDGLFELCVPVGGAADEHAAAELEKLRAEVAQLEEQLQAELSQSKRLLTALEYIHSAPRLPKYTPILCDVVEDMSHVPCPNLRAICHNHSGWKFPSRRPELRCGAPLPDGDTRCDIYRGHCKEHAGWEMLLPAHNALTRARLRIRLCEKRARASQIQSSAQRRHLGQQVDAASSAPAVDDDTVLG